MRERASQRIGQECCFLWSLFALQKRGGSPCVTEISIIVSVFLPLSHYALTSLQLKNTSIMCQSIFHFYGPKKAIKLTQK